MAAPHLISSKAEARSAALARRAACDPAWGAALPAHAAGWPVPGAAVAGFWPLPGEIDTRPLLHAWHTRGLTVLLPRTPPAGERLTFHLWHPGAELLPGRFGTLAPAGPPMEPDALLAPLLAFDAAGRRLGYGGGFYDRTLAALPGRAVLGCAFAAQRVGCVPAGPYDIRLPAVLTERGIERFGDPQ